ncbi:hypothetical protein ABIA32_005899 [Streptacidiphilus sp. MAP12-20]|uniref:hypothetical protein n=1 Tax=Streptacidiphilus sp. MAP12-20 TaxID=3156299 RepID=UPI0035173328
MIADLTPADMVADPISCLAIFEDRMRIEQRRMELLDAVLRELRQITQARKRLHALLDGEPVPEPPARPRPPRPAASAGAVPRQAARRPQRPRPQLEQAMEIMGGDPQRRWSAPEIAALIGADADWLRFVLHSAANRGLIQRHAQAKPTGARGRPVAIQFSLGPTSDN